jgi:hypothetical protein
MQDLGEDTQQGLASAQTCSDLFISGEQAIVSTVN